MRKMLSVILSSLMIFSLSACANTGSANEWAAKVNDVQISISDYEKNLAIIKKQIEATVGADIWTQDSGQGKTYSELLKDQVLEKLIEDQLILVEAKKENIELVPEEFEKEFTTFKEQVKGLPDYETFLKAEGITDEFLRKQLETDSIVYKYKEKFMEKNTPSDEDLQKYYDENQEAYNINEVKASHILLKTVDANFVPLPAEKIAGIKASAEGILARVKAGEDFAALAKEFSEDEASAVNGGDLGFFAKGVMVKEFEEAAFALEPNETSGLVESTYGYHIIKVIEKKNEVTPFEEVKDSIKSNLAQEAYVKFLESLKTSSKVEKNEEAIKKAAEEQKKTEVKEEQPVEEMPAVEPPADQPVEVQP